MQVDGGDAQPLPDENQEYFCGDTVAPDVSLFMSIPFLGVLLKVRCKAKPTEPIEFSISGKLDVGWFCAIIFLESLKAGFRLL